MPEFTCKSCGGSFELPDAVLAKYPGWNPNKCRKCRDAGQGASMSTTAAPKSAARRPAASTGGRSSTSELDLPCAEVLKRFHDGPKTGVFTDGAASPNPGPGGWGAVYVVDDVIIAEDLGHEPKTTNNRMELLALLASLALVPLGSAATIYTDSQLCVNTFTTWAKGWEKRGWKRKDGEIKNLELVKEIYLALKTRPKLKLEWIPAHNGQRWNEYADALATAYRRRER